MAVVQALYYTDPLCPWSWALEPTLRRLQCDLGQELRLTYVMSGMGNELQDPAPSVCDALRRFGTMSAAEVAAVCGLSGPAAATELWRLATEWQARPERLGTAELWTRA